MALPLSKVTFYRMPDVSPTAATTAAFLDAVYNTLTSSVDYRGTSLASTHLWTWARQQSGSTTKAVYNTACPSGTPMQINPGIIIAGEATVAAATMLSPDVAANNVPMIGIVKNPGAFLTYDNANPMTSGQFSGYSNFVPTTVTVTNGTNTIVRTFISQESVFFQIIGSSTSQYWAHVGALIEPHTAYADSSYNTYPCCETDDRLYALSTSNIGAVLHPSFLSTAPTIYNHAAVNGQNHFVCFAPTTSTILSPLRRRLPATAQYNIYEDRDLNDKIIVDSFTILRSSLNNLGVSRGVYAYGTARAGQVFVRSGTTDLFHVLSSDTFNSSQALALAAAP